MTDKKSFTIPLHEPSWKEKSSFFFQGIMLSVPLTLFYESFIENYLLLFMSRQIAVIFLATLLAPIIEEYSKMIPLFHRHAETEKSLVMLGFIIGLGFGLTEFIIYVLRGVPFWIRLPGIFFHASTTSIIAYGMTRKKMRLYYVFAVILHGTHNLFAEVGGLWFIGRLSIILMTYYFSWRSYKKATKSIVTG